MTLLYYTNRNINNCSISNTKKGKVKDMRKTTLAIYKWDDNKAWIYVGCTPISEQAENIINNYKKQGIKSKTVLRYL